GLGAQREHVAGARQVGGGGAGRHGGADGGGAVGGADAGVDPLLRLDGDGEGGAAARGVVLHHGRQLQAVGHPLLERQADHAAGVADHEGDALLGGERRGQDQVALVLAVLVVDEDQGAPGAQLREEPGHAGELRLGLAGAPGRSSAWRSSCWRSRCLASTSLSTFTRGRGSSSPRVVTASVCGTSHSVRSVAGQSGRVPPGPPTSTSVRLKQPTVTPPLGSRCAASASGATPLHSWAPGSSRRPYTPPAPTCAT